ncbi:type I restriction enzyme modification subunit [Helicobacter cinaedi]|uniref:site-specific DNA-methyltransferase (adenine-specific) n=1 Tax=Helicobacter cinaedi TaxID=213 RepID=A0A377JQU2_9HELI|nr:N-6 DNA methylase [Helicobacter cinaedi]STP10247.1 type I restriction enzyme modification subunit [Helicobacter cinaedi]
MAYSYASKELLGCFEYIKRYHTDMLDSIAIMLELFWLKHHATALIESLITLGNKRKPIYESFSKALQEAFGTELYTPLNPNANLLKILKVIHSQTIANSTIEEFLHIITQKKTTHKLFSYSTPLEINELLVGILDIKEKESVYNPCYGMGSLFFAICNHAKNVELYGEELESTLAKIAKITCKILSLSPQHLVLNNILTNAQFKHHKFDKIICNPPLDSHVGTQFLKEDERFSSYETLIKTYPELLFLIHSLSHLKDKGVFILRTQTLLKSSLEGRLREKLCEDRLIEAIIELPKNIFPHQTQDFSIIVLSQHNDSILHINANTPHFYRKDGKYNRLINLSSLLALYKHKATSEHSTLTPLKQINPHDLSVGYYLHKPKQEMADSLYLKDLQASIFRGQRVYGSPKDEKITFFDLGVADFAEFGFCDEFSTQRFKGDKTKIHKYALKPYDIAISLRGNTPKFTILSPEAKKHIIVANAGIVVLRAPSEEIAIGIYCYLFSHKGQKALGNIYERLGVLNPNDLENLPIPRDFTQSSQKIFAKIQDYALKLREIESQLQKLRD